MEEIKQINIFPNVRDNSNPQKTMHGSYVWLREEDTEFYSNWLGLFPPQDNMEPKKIKGNWYWVTIKNGKG